MVGMILYHHATSAIRKRCTKWSEVFKNEEAAHNALAWGGRFCLPLQQLKRAKIHLFTDRGDEPFSFEIP